MPTKKPTNPLTGSARSLRSGSRLIGPADPNERFSVTVRVRPKRALPSPDSIGLVPPLKRRYLTREQYAAAGGAAPADLAKVKAFASRSGLRVLSASAAERNVKLSGTVRAYSAAFDVKLMRYAHPDGDYRGRIGSIHLPPDLAKVIQGVFGLDNRPQARPHIARSRKPRPAKAPASGPVPFTAPQVAQLYGFPGGTDGTGECIGIIEFGGGYSATDLASYFKKLGIPVPAITSVAVDGVSNQPGSNPDYDGEVALDIEVAGAIAPGAKLVVYFAPFTEQGWVDVLTAAINDKVNKPSVVSISWGYAEGAPVQGFEWTLQTVQAVNETLQGAAAMGVTVCVASGDDGSSDDVNDGHAHVDFPASSPYVLGCGGTRLLASGTSIASEVVWNDGPGSGGGGGISDLNAIPSWQVGIVPPSVNPGAHVGRGVPDVCGDADPDSGYEIFYGGKSAVVGGTSAVAPLWAALLARINQGLGTPVGYFNPLLYAKLGTAGCFNDIVTGNNDVTGKVGGYFAGKGWDACSGWGSPIGASLLSGFGGAPAAKRSAARTRKRSR